MYEDMAPAQNLPPAPPTTASAPEPPAVSALSWKVLNPFPECLSALLKLFPGTRLPDPTPPTLQPLGTFDGIAVPLCLALTPFEYLTAYMQRHGISRHEAQAKTARDTHRDTLQKCCTRWEREIAKQTALRCAGRDAPTGRLLPDARFLQNVIDRVAEMDALVEEAKQLTAELMWLVPEQKRKHRPRVQSMAVYLQ
jgi:hypothetical protein